MGRKKRRLGTNSSQNCELYDQCEELINTTEDFDRENVVEEKGVAFFHNNIAPRKEIDLIGCCLSSSEVDELIGILFNWGTESIQRIEKVSLIDAEINDIALSKLCQFLDTHNWCGILDVTGVKIGPFAAAGIACLMANEHLCALDMHQSEMADADLTLILSELTKNSKLKLLDIGYCDLDRNNTTILAHYLASDQATLENFKCEWILANPLEEVLRALTSNTSVRIFDLSGYEFSEKNFAELCKLIAQNKTIMRTTLTSSNLNDSMASDLADALNKNTSLTFIDVTDTLMQPSVIKKIQAIINKKNETEDRNIDPL